MKRLSWAGIVAAVLLIVVVAVIGNPSPDKRVDNELIAHWKSETKASSPDPEKKERAKTASSGVNNTMLARHIKRVTDKYAGDLGIAVYSGRGTFYAGDTSARPAWSTIKVPISIAALRKNPAMTEYARAALTVSDNDAAIALWQSLGDSNQAAEAVENAIAESGAPVSLRPRNDHSPFLPFGETAWSPLDQAQFAAHLPCITGASAIRPFLAEIDEEQSWGIGQLDAEFKGGWGPMQSGEYELRQMGLIASDGGGVVGVAVSAQPDDGSFDTGQKMLNRLVKGLATQLEHTPNFECTQSSERDDQRD